MYCNALLAKGVSRLKKRQDFLRAHCGLRIKADAFLIESYKRDSHSKGPIVPLQIARVGFTVTRKNGNAIVRNRIKRRLSEAVRIGLQNNLLAGYDYVIIARKACLYLPFEELLKALKEQINKCNSAYCKFA